MGSPDAMWLIIYNPQVFIRQPLSVSFWAQSGTISAPSPLE
jgi:hypothetical protein